MELGPSHDRIPQALVLCGGLGTRLRTVVGAQPKALAPVAGRAFLDYQFRYLKSLGLSSVVLCTGYGADQVREYVGDGRTDWGVDVTFSREEEPLGTGGAVKNAEVRIATDPFMVLNGDSLVGVDLPQLVAAHWSKRAVITVGLVEVVDKERYGAVGVAGDGSVTAFCEKGGQGPGLINAGVYLMSRRVLDEIPSGRAVSLEREVFPCFVGRGLYGLPIPGPFLDIGTVESFAKAADFLTAWAGGSDS